MSLLPIARTNRRPTVWARITKIAIAEVNASRTGAPSAVTMNA
jgi:hypothetical protein